MGSLLKIKIKDAKISLVLFGPDKKTDRIYILNWSEGLRSSAGQNAETGPGVTLTPTEAHNT